MLSAFFSFRRNRVAAALLAGAMLHSVVSLHPWWPLAWIAPIPLLLAAFYATPGEATVLSFLAAGMGVFSLASYYRVVMGGWLLTLVILFLQAWGWAGIVAITRRFAVKSRAWWVVLVYPVLWAALDTLITFFSPHSSWGSLAYSQGEAVPVIQIAALAGLAGIVFAISLFASLVAVVLYRGAGIQRPVVAYGLPAVVVLSVLAYGEVHLAQAPAPTLVPAGMAAIDDAISADTPEVKIGAVWRGYDDAVAGLAARGAKLVLLPEKIEILESEPARQRLALLAAAARGGNVYIAAGTGLRQDRILRNRAWLFDPSGEIVRTYDKHHMVPGLEREFTPGQDYSVETIGGVRYGFAICKDMHFPSVGRAYGRLGAQAVLVPAWDFERDAWMAARLTAFRGVESGFTIIRASREGLLTVTDRYGRVAAEIHSAAAPGATLLANAPIAPASAPTFYVRFGDVFGWGCVLLAIALRVFARRLTAVF